MKVKNPQRIYRDTVCIWMAAVVVHACFHIASVMAGPPSPDLYANSWGFQIVAFAFTWFFVWVLGLMLVLVIEFTIFGRKFG